MQAVSSAVLRIEISIFLCNICLPKIKVNGERLWVYPLVDRGSMDNIAQSLDIRDLFEDAKSKLGR